jgi:hypothetical protein
MSEEQYARLIRWFETLSTKVDGLRTDMEAQFARVNGELHEIRELLAHQQDDDRVQRQAIANLDRRVETLEKS